MIKRQTAGLMAWALAALMLAAQLVAVVPARASDANDVLALVNQQRVAGGLQPLALCPTLTAAAQGHSEDMAANNYFSHISQDGRTPAQRITAAGYTGWTNIGENIAVGQETPQQVFDSWWGSTGHRENMMDPAFRHMGLGTARGDYQQYENMKYWTQTFGANGDCDGNMVAPTLLTPSGIYVGTQPVFQWSAPAGAVRYEIALGTDNPPTTAPVSVTITSYTPPAPLLIGAYYWQVRAFNAVGVPSDWSSVGTVTIESASTDAPVTGYYTGLPFTLTWSAVMWATGYIVQVYTHPTIASDTDIEQAISQNKTSFQIMALPDGIYTWRVCAQTAAGTCLWSPAARFGVKTP